MPTRLARGNSVGKPTSMAPSIWKTSILGYGVEQATGDRLCLQTQQSSGYSVVFRISSQVSNIQQSSNTGRQSSESRHETARASQSRRRGSRHGPSQRSSDGRDRRRCDWPAAASSRPGSKRSEMMKRGSGSGFGALVRSSWSDDNMIILQFFFHTYRIVGYKTYSHYAALGIR